MRKARYVVEVDKATLDFINELRDHHNERNPGAGWRQKDTVRHLAECHRVGIAALAAAAEAELAARAESPGPLSPREPRPWKPGLETMS